MGSNRYHISQRADGKWEGKREGFGRVSILAQDREEVERRTRELARKRNAEVVVHGAPDATKQDTEDRTLG